MSCLPDINVWLALSFSAHPHHKAALAWFERAAPSSCAFCRMTQQGFLRLASNPAVFKSDALSLPNAWKAYDSLSGDERVRYEPEPPPIEPEWRALTKGEQFSARIWNDAFLAAFARCGAFELVTFDKSFSRYPRLRLRVLG